MFSTWRKENILLTREVSIHDLIIFWFFSYILTYFIIIWHGISLKFPMGKIEYFDILGTSKYYKDLMRDSLTVKV